MKCSTVALIKTPRLPRPRNRHFTRILAKQCTGNMQSTSPSSSKKNDGSSKPTSPTSTNQPRGDGMAELSDVQCYTCRRRHVKCDRQLPTCAKCAKKGVPCLGYQKPLRWAEGVAVRGKLKGKSRPVVDSECQYLIVSLKPSHSPKATL
ncbi:hypothetical protein EJ04DRAFT_58094 [Polyplosphaeria fusca]|uniref:Zn(2)-C6 fungal-type domain-containing protein n=1 Tax=Polyplosphaeria fusca TaxID=682080 RepID=A0A9P4QS85_9PLEO|nr:hypothetical protein EJ04DRAFT_58094 [Polyplosphaeria fusca]